MDISEESIEKLFAKYELFLQGSPYTALQLLGELYSILPDLDEDLRLKWAKKIKREKISSNTIKLVEAELEKDVKHLKHLLFITLNWNYEVIVLILSLRIQIHLVLALFRELNFKETNVNLDSIDKNIILISEGKKTRDDFKSAVRTIAKNLGRNVIPEWVYSLK
jgi:hypothetical protein